MTQPLDPSLYQPPSGPTNLASAPVGSPAPGGPQPYFAPSSAQGAMVQGMGMTSPQGMGGGGVGGSFVSNGAMPTGNAASGAPGSPSLSQINATAPPGGPPSPFLAAPPATSMQAATAQASSPTPWQRVFAGLGAAGRSLSPQTAQSAPFNPSSLTPAQIQAVVQHAQQHGMMPAQAPPQGPSAAAAPPPSGAAPTAGAAPAAMAVPRPQGS